MDLLLPLPSIWTQLFIRITANKLFPLELLKMSVIILKKTKQKQNPTETNKIIMTNEQQGMTLIQY